MRLFLWMILGSLDMDPMLYPGGKAHYGKARGSATAIIKNGSDVLTFILEVMLYS